MPACPPFRAVYFDCDSTLTAIEGVDELLRFVPADLRADIAALTTQAMEGTLPLEQVYETRLRLLAPRRELLDQIGRFYVERTTPDARATIEALQSVSIHTGIVSGGLLLPVQALAAHLGIPLANVHAVPLLFHPDGAYRDFNRSSPLWRNGGKVTVLQHLPPNHRPVCFVGDGATDLETQGTADLFVGYGGVAVRQKVKEHAERWFDTESLAPLLSFVLTPAERQRLAAEPRFAPLLARAGT